MKFLKKLISIFISILILSSFSSSTTAFASTDITSPDITTYKDVIRWRYKTIDGKLYKRQYNYSKKQWIGSWERV